MLTAARLPLVWLAVAVSVSAASCQVAPGQPPSGGTEEQPGPGSVEVRGDPENAAVALVIQFVGQEGNVVTERTSRIATGEVIEADMINLPETMTLLVNGMKCEGDFTIESDKRTHVVLRFGEAGCSVETKDKTPM